MQASPRSLEQRIALALHARGVPLSLKDHSALASVAHVFGLRALEGEDALLSPNQHSRGHVCSRLPPSSAVLRCIHCPRSPAYSRGASNAKDRPPALMCSRLHRVGAGADARYRITHGTEPTLDSVPWRYGTRRLRRRSERPPAPRRRRPRLAHHRICGGERRRLLPAGERASPRGRPRGAELPAPRVADADARPPPCKTACDR